MVLCWIVLLSMVEQEHSLEDAVTLLAGAVKGAVSGGGGTQELLDGVVSPTRNGSDKA